MFKEKKNTLKIAFILSIFVFVSSIGGKLYLCSVLAVKNGDLEKTIASKKEIEKEISRLSFENSNLSSIEIVEKKAKDLGFVEMSERLLSVDPSAPIQVAVLQ